MEDFGEQEPIPLSVFFEAFGEIGFTPDIQVDGSPLSIPAQVASGLCVSLSNRSNLFASDPRTTLLKIDVSPGNGPATKRAWFMPQTARPTC